MTEAAQIYRGDWPRWMRAETAAAYVDELSAEAFRRKVGSVYPEPSYGKGRGARWDRIEIDRACGKSEAPTPTVDAVNLY